MSYIALFLTATCATLLFITLFFYRRRFDHHTLDAFGNIRQITALYTYPIKSFCDIRLETSKLTACGSLMIGYMLSRIVRKRASTMSSQVMTTPL